MDYYRDPETKEIFGHKRRDNLEAIDLGPKLEYVEDLKVGDCVMTTGGSIGWVCSISSWGDYEYRFSGDMSYAYDRMNIKYYLPKWSIPVEKHSYVKYKGELFKVTKTSLDSDLEVYHYIRSPYRSESYYISKDFEPVELSPPKPISGEGKYLLAKSLCGRYNFVQIRYSAYVDLSNTDPIDINSESPAFTFEWVNELPTQGDKVLSNFTSDQVYKVLEKFESYSQITRWLYGHFYEEIKNVPYFGVRIMLTAPRQSTIDRTAIALYQNSKKLDEQRLTFIRPGRAFKFIFPELPDKYVEAMVDKFRKDFPTGEYEVKRSREAWAFKHMYSHEQATMQNPATTVARKSLAYSCMRHDFDHLPRHPCEAYASGEFEAVWSETSDGRIASRVVVWHPPEGNDLHGKPQMGPVYGVCEYSIDLLESSVEGGVKFTNATWSGAKMLYIPHRDGAIAPYLDHEQSLEIDGNYLIVDGSPDFEADNYEGVLGSSYYATCEHCGDNIRDEDDAYSTSNGTVCEHCFNNHYFTCHEYGESYPNDQAVSVMARSGWRATGYETVLVHEDARENHYTECTDGEYWRNDLVIEIRDEEFLSPRDYNTEDYKTCESDGQIYPVTEMVPHVDGGFIAKVNLDTDTQALNEQGEVYELA